MGVARFARERAVAVAALLLWAACGCAAARGEGEGGERSRRVELHGPAVLDRSHTEYVLKRDIEAGDSAFVIEASHVTLNLNGHRVVYGADGGPRAFGVSVPGYHRRDIHIRGGSIVQKPGSGCRGDAHGAGCNPIHFTADVDGARLTDLEIVWEAPSTSGIHMHWGKNVEIARNILTDNGTELENRHQGVAAIEAGRGGGMRIHGNRITRARHNGVRAGDGAEIFDNDIFIDSVATNSVGIVAAGGRIRENRIVGRGVHPIGIWPGSHIEVTGNYVNVKNTRPGEEYGSTGAACLRMTWGNDAVVVTDNLFVLEAAEAEEEGGMESWGRALWVGLPEPGQRALFARNLIVANNRRGRAKAAGIAVVCNNASPHLVFRENTVISNWGAVLLADDYGHADGYPLFVGNTFVRQDDFPTYRTIRSAYPQRPSTGIFIDNRCLNGASCDDADFQWYGEGKKEAGFGRTVVVAVRDADGRPMSGAEVEVADTEGRHRFSGVTDGAGEVRAEVVDYVLSNQGSVPAAAAATPASLRRPARSEVRVRSGGDVLLHREIGGGAREIPARIELRPGRPEGER